MKIQVLQITNKLDIIKLPLFFILAIILNFLVFLMIQHMVSKQHGSLLHLEDVNLVDFIRLEQKPEPPKSEKTEEQIKEPPPDEEPPPPPKLSQPELAQPQTMDIELPAPDIDLPLSLNGKPFLGNYVKAEKPRTRIKPKKPVIDTSVVPTIKIPPVYPRRALRMGIEGIVTVEFTIATDGSVKDPKIVKAKPPKIFDRAVLAAIQKWKFNPDIVDGKPVEKRARQDIKFKLQN